MHNNSGTSGKVVTERAAGLRPGAHIPQAPSSNLGPATTAEDHPFDSHFVRAVHQMTLYRPHLNACRGSESLKRKKRTGEKAMRYDEVVGFLINARRDGARRGQGAEAVAVLLNEITKDSLPAGELLDVIAAPAAGNEIRIGSRGAEELKFAVSASRLITTVEKAAADGRIDLAEDRQLEQIVDNVGRESRRLAEATRQEARR